MHFGLEARVPFAHNDLLALASTIAPELAMKNQCEKYCLKQIASGKIPSAIINRIKSSLPKDQSVGALYQQEFKIIAANSLTEDLIGRYLNWPEINRIASKAPLLTEKERAILFKVIAFYYWFVQLS
jgi:asparagine synthetase B (glutamine-hydrolysing)